MTLARRRQVCVESTPYYHCIARCVRRAYLCGEDPLSGRSFDHRKQWLVDKLKALSAVFAIDICAYAIMSNHYHVVLRVDAARAAAWPQEQVMARWRCLFKGALPGDGRQGDVALSAAEREAVSTRVEIWRRRLSDISWFMRCLNESIARRANEEDACKGRFWEGRFKSQALLDEAALLTCMSYVDLNPVRAGVHETPEASVFTSIYERIKQIAARTPQATPAGLLPFVGNHERGAEGLPFRLMDYLQLVDWVGRAIRAGKRGAIPAQLAPMMERLGLPADGWVDQVKHHGRQRCLAFGSSRRVKAFSERLGQAWLWGQAE